jgi:hypothetical protein
MQWEPYYGMYETGAELRKDGELRGRVDRPDCDCGWQWWVGWERHHWFDGECDSLEDGKRLVEEWMRVQVVPGKTTDTD